MSVTAAGLGYVTATLLVSADAMPAHTRWRGEIDFSDIYFDDINVVAEFSQITRCDLAVQAGIVVRRHEVAYLGEDKSRHNVYPRLFIEIENTTADAITFADAKLVLGGTAATPGFALPRQTVPDLASTPDTPFSVTDLDGAARDTAWFQIPLGLAGDSSLLNGEAGSYYLDRTNHTGAQAISTVTALQAALDAKADLASPALTGTPTVPTASPSTNNTQAASTAYTDAAVAALVNAAPSTLDTLGEIADQLASDESAATALTATVGTKLAKTSNLSDLASAPAARTNLGLTRAVNQTGHGFAVGDLIKSTGSDTYAKAKADSAANAEVVGIVTAVADADNFTFAATGAMVTGLSGLTAGTVYFLDPSTAGAMTATAPSTAGQVAKPVLVAVTATAGVFVNYLGIVIDDGASDGVNIPLATVTAKGDLIVASASGAVGNLPGGTDGDVLTRNAAATLGVNWATPSGGGGGGGDLIKIATVLLASAAASIDFTSIPGTYGALFVGGQCRNTTAGGYISMTPNGETTNLVQSFQEVGTSGGGISLFDSYNYGAGSGAYDHPWTNLCDGTPQVDGAAEAMSRFTLWMYNYANTTFWKTGRCEGVCFDNSGSGVSRIFQVNFRYRSTAAITELSFFPYAGGNFDVGTRITLWGLNS